MIRKNEDYNIVNMGMFNLVKGIAVIGILLEHTAYEIFAVQISGPVQYVVFSIHNSLIPMFLIVSGYGFRKSNIRKGIRYQVRFLLVPFWVSGIASTVLSFITQGLLTQSWFSALNVAGKYAGGALLGLSYDLWIDGSVMFFGAGTVWYLLTLFWCWLLMNFIMARLQKKWLPVCIVILMLIGRAISTFVSLPYCILPALIGIGYYYLGWWTKERKCIQRQPKTFVAALVVCLALASGLIGRFNLATCEWTWGILDIVAAGASGLLLTWIGVYLSAYEFPLKGMLQWIGRNCLWLLVLHTIEYHGIPWKNISMVIRQIGVPRAGTLLLIIIMKVVVIAFGYGLVTAVRSGLAKTERKRKRA